MKEFDTIANDLKNKVYYPIYFLMGEEPYFTDVIAEMIENTVLDPAEKEFNLRIIYGKETDVGMIISYAKSYPMMSNYQVLIIREAQDVKNIEDLQSYAENPLKSTILVICYKYHKIDKRKAFTKLIDKTGVLFESPKIYDNQVAGWITKQLTKKGYSIEPKAAQMMADFIGIDLGRIMNELGKLIINVPPGAQISALHIEQNIGISKDYNVFELQKALGEKNIMRSNEIIKYFGENIKENPLVKIIPIIYLFFSKLLLYHQLVDKSKNNAAAELGVNPYFVGDYVSAARNYSITKLIKVFSYLKEYDLKSKGVNSGTAGDSDLMKEMIYKILH